jgi:NADPH-dependent glutamate synthase beta subunit-like oxidoreductase
LVVHAVRDGRKAAAGIHQYLTANGDARLVRQGRFS